MKLSRIGSRLLGYASFKSDNEDKACFSMFLAENQTMYKGYEKPRGEGIIDKVIPTNNIEHDYKQLHWQSSKN